MIIINNYLKYLNETKEEKDRSWWEKFWDEKKKGRIPNVNLECVKRLREKYKIYEYEKRKQPVPYNVDVMFKKEAHRVCRVLV